MGDSRVSVLWSLSSLSEQQIMWVRGMFLVIRARCWVVTVLDFHGMIIVSENIPVSWHHGLSWHVFIQISFIKNNQVDFIIDYILV